MARIFGVDEVLTIGPGAAPTAREAGGQHLPDSETALAWLRSNLEPADVVLVKGARVSALDRLVEELLEFVPSRPRPVGAAR